MAVKVSRRKLRPKEREETGELNIVPYLDILMNLIMFMLLSMTGLAAFGVLNVTSPRYSQGGGGGQVDKPKMLLTVLIGERGFYVAGAGAILGGTDAPPNSGTGGREPSIPRNADGTYDFKKLTAQMVEVKKAYPDETKVIIGADPTVPYGTLVKTMDACREHDGQTLFFDVSLTVL